MNKRLKYILLGACWCIALTCSCINQLNLDEGTETDRIAISVEDKALQSLIGGKLKNPQCGLYVGKAPNNSPATYEIANVPCIIEKKGITPTKEIFYPDGSNRMKVVSYFPYSKEGWTGDSIAIEAAADQTTDEKYIVSDFMLAEHDDVAPSKNKIKLNHTHKCAVVTVQIRTELNSDLDKLYKGRPTATLRNLHRKGWYLINEERFEPTPETEEIQLNGSWKKQGRRLVGKKAIVLPQPIPANTEVAQIVVDGKIFSCRASNDIELIEGKENHIIVDYDPLIGVNAVSAEITDWEEGSTTEVTMEEVKESDTIDIQKLDFNLHPVYTIAHKGRELMQICREYVSTEEVKDQAIVVYPIRNKNVDLNEGLVLNLLHTDRQIHGGKLSWDATTNTARYSIGFTHPLRYLYADETGNIATTKPEKALKTYPIAYQLKDKRENELRCYNLVKIGTQYWTQQNLKTVYYNNHTKITHRTPGTYNKTTAAYFSNDEELFYNKAAVTSGKLIPQGFRIPTMKDVERLKSYIGNNAGVLKSPGKWSNTELECTGLAGFNATPNGIFTESVKGGESVFDFEGVYMGLWTSNESGDGIGNYVVMISNRKGTLLNGSHSDFSGYSVRCILEM